jgi:hypothetical protein
MAALVEFLVMATFLGAIPNRCLSVIRFQADQPPSHEAFEKASGRDAQQSRHDPQIRHP